MGVELVTCQTLWMWCLTTRSLQPVLCVVVEVRLAGLVEWHYIEPKLLLRRGPSRHVTSNRGHPFTPDIPSCSVAVSTTKSGIALARGCARGLTGDQWQDQDAPFRDRGFRQSVRDRDPWFRDRDLSSTLSIFSRPIHILCYQFVLVCNNFRCSSTWQYWLKILSYSW